MIFSVPRAWPIFLRGREHRVWLPLNTNWARRGGRSNFSLRESSLAGVPSKRTSRDSMYVHLSPTLFVIPRRYAARTDLDKLLPNTLKISTLKQGIARDLPVAPMATVHLPAARLRLKFGHHWNFLPTAAAYFTAQPGVQGLDRTQLHRYKPLLLKLCVWPSPLDKACHVKKPIRLRSWQSPLTGQVVDHSLS